MIELVLQRHTKSLGGFDVGRVLPQMARRMIGPFIFFDHMGPADFAAGLPRSVDVRPHPHIGLSTITYLFDGEIMHRDSVGSHQAIRPGEVNWMTAGKGITHSERFERARAQGDRLHGIQSWVALPESDEEGEPAFSHHAAADLPLLEEAGARTRLIAGRLLGLESKARTHSPMFYAHCALQPGARFGLPAEYSERAVYVADGSVQISGQAFKAGQMACLGSGGTAAIQAETPALVMLLGGEPLGRRYIEWNFVSSSKERIEQAKADWRAGRLKLPAGDAEEFIPLPE